MPTLSVSCYFRKHLMFRYLQCILINKCACQNYRLYINKVIKIERMQEPTSTEFSEQDEPKKQNPQPAAAAQVDQTHIGGKINQNFLERTRWTVFMLIIFVVVIIAGQTGCVLVTLATNFFIFKEINSIKRNEEKEANIPMTKYLNWYFYALANYFCFGNFFLPAYPAFVMSHPAIHTLYTYHAFICYSGFILGFVAFVLSLKQGFLKYQFRLFAWIILTTIMVVLQSWLIVMNSLRGIIWFVLPVLLIICNDIFAYLVGYFFGSHQLIALSPKKTWEGYLGGAFFTLLFSYILVSTFMTVPGFACPMTSVDFTPFRYPVCDTLGIYDEDISPSFIPISITAIHFHAFVLSLFASTIGPFGGFFASGLKRSIKIKDFSNLIPGHGGISDRMDCQLIMGGFTYFYLSAFLYHSGFNTSFWLNHLNPSQQLVLLEELTKRFGQLSV